MSLLLLAYMIIAFVAGVVALAMPCCFSVLLPSYFAQSFKQKARLIGMTLIFSLGIATIMLPLAGRDGSRTDDQSQSQLGLRNWRFRDDNLGILDSVGSRHASPV